MVVLGRGGSGKSTFCQQVEAQTGVTAIELDAHFWDASLAPLPHEEWISRQNKLLSSDQWIADGDLGPYDVLAARLDRATHVVVLDLPLWLCCLRALRRGRENLDFWRWTITWGCRERPRIEAAIRASPAHPTALLLRSRQEVAQLLRDVGHR